MSSRFVILTSLALGALLVGCGEPVVIKTEEVPVDQDVTTPDDAPPADDDTAAPEDGNIWAKHVGDIPWVIGSEKGFAQAKKEGKPLLIFYTATW